MDPSFYKEDGWNALDPVDRAQLLLVIEGAKPGTIIGANHTTFKEITKSAGLVYSFNTQPLLLGPVVEVARPEEMAKYQMGLMMLPERATEDDYHKAVGAFLGYPACCTEEYVRERTPEQRAAARRGARHMSYRFGQ